MYKRQPNGHPLISDTKFPQSNVNKGDYVLRTDFLPNRLFRYDGNRWVRIEDAVRLSATFNSNDPDKNNYKTKFINNSSTSTINGLTVEQRQSLTDALKPKEDE